MTAERGDGVSGDEGEVARRLVSREGADPAQVEIEVIISQAVAHEEQWHGMEEGRKGVPELRVSEHRAIVVLADEAPARSLQERAVQLEDEVPAVGDVSRGARQAGPAARESPLEQMIDVGGEDGAQAGRERGDGTGHMGFSHACIVQVSFNEGAELGRAQADLECRERIDVLPRGSQLGDLLKLRTRHLKGLSMRGQQVHELLPPWETCGGGDASSGEDDQIAGLVGLAQLGERRVGGAGRLSLHDRGL